MRFRYLAALVAAALLMALPAVAQEQRGAIEGVVKDAQGGAVVGATVVAKSMSGHRGRGRDRRHRHVPLHALPPGRYEITANLSGFAPAQGAEHRPAPRPAAQHQRHATARRGGRDRAGRGRVAAHRDHPERARHLAPRRGHREDAEGPRLHVARHPGPRSQHGDREVRRASWQRGISIDGSSAGENRYIIDGAESTNLQSRHLRASASSPTSSTRCRSSPPATPPSTAAPPAASSTSSPRAAPTASAAMSGSTSQGDALELRPAEPSLRLKPTNSNAAEYVTYPEDSYNRLEPGLHPRRPDHEGQGLVLRGLQPVVPALRPHRVRSATGPRARSTRS